MHACMHSRSCEWHPRDLVFQTRPRVSTQVKSVRTGNEASLCSNKLVRSFRLLIPTPPLPAFPHDPPFADTQAPSIICVSSRSQFPCSTAHQPRHAAERKYEAIKKKMAPKSRARVLIARLVSTAGTGYFYATKRLRTADKLAKMKYDPVGECPPAPLTLSLSASVCHAL